LSAVHGGAAALEQGRRLVANKCGRALIESVALRRDVTPLYRSCSVANNAAAAAVAILKLAAQADMKTYYRRHHGTTVPRLLLLLLRYRQSMTCNGNSDS